MRWRLPRVDTLRASASGTPVITILDLGGGWLPSDLKLAGECFGYTPPRVDQMQGDGVATAIKNADPETSLDLQTSAAVAPKAQFRLVQSTAQGGGILDGFSRALGDPAGVPDVISLSYGGCAIAENTATPAFTSTIDGVLAMAALTGVSSFVAAGDSGSTTCGSSVDGTSLSYPAVSPFVTAVGGTRLTLGKGNVRVSETVWNDSVYGDNGAGGGALSRREPRPAYQDGFVPQNHRAVPDVSALADIVPGWPDILDGEMVPVGGTSGSDALYRRRHRPGRRFAARGGPSPDRAGERMVLPGRVTSRGVLRHHHRQQRPRQRRMLPGHRRLRPRQRPRRAELGRPARHPPLARLTGKGRPR